MADAWVRCHGHSEDANYFAADKNQDIGAVSLGYGPDDSRSARIIQVHRDA